MTVQPASTEIATRTAAVIAEMRGLEAPLLPILHGIQDEFGFVPQEALPVIAEALDLSRAEIHGVVSFYHDYRSHPAGRHVIKICQAEACQSMGSEAITARLKQLLGIGLHETALEGSVTLEPVYCLGLCACAPAALIDGRPAGRLDAVALDEIVAEVRA
jgi:formate dehydrogenase subunit gamma